MRSLFACLAVLLSCTGAILAQANELTRPIDAIALHPERSASATAVSNNHATLSAQISAQVQAIHVGVSQRVAAGDLLVTLDCTDYQLALQMAKAEQSVAEARLALAERQKKRTEQLLGKQLASQEAADNAEVALIASRGENELARLGVNRAEIDIKRCQVYAPFAAVVTQRSVSEGDFAAVGTPLLLLTDTSQIELSAQVKPEDIAQLDTASELWFEANATRFPVALLRAGGVINAQTRNQEIRLQFTQQTPPPGAAGKLIWFDPRPFIPADYVVKRGGQLGIFTARNGVAEFIALPGAVPGRPAWTTLPGDELIIIDQLGQLQSGQALSSL